MADELRKSVEGVRSNSYRVQYHAILFPINHIYASYKFPLNLTQTILNNNPELFPIPTRSFESALLHNQCMRTDTCVTSPTLLTRVVIVVFLVVRSAVAFLTTR